MKKKVFFVRIHQDLENLFWNFPSTILKSQMLEPWSTILRGYGGVNTGKLLFNFFVMQRTTKGLQNYPKLPATPKVKTLSPWAK
jgi:hypothetical protein